MSDSEWAKVAQDDVEARERRGGGAFSQDIAGSIGAERMVLRMWRYAPGNEMAYHRHGAQEEIYQLVADNEIQRVLSTGIYRVGVNFPELQLLINAEGRHQPKILGAQPVTCG